MAKTLTQPLTQTITQIGQTIVSATGFIATTGSLNAPANTLLLATAGADGSIIKSLTIAGDNSAVSAVQFWQSKLGTPYTVKELLFTVLVPVQSGSATSATAALVNVDVFGNALVVGLPFDQLGKPVLSLAAGASLHIGVVTAAVASGRAIYVAGSQEDF